MTGGFLEIRINLFLESHPVRVFFKAQKGGEIPRRSSKETRKKTCWQQYGRERLTQAQLMARDKAEVRYINSRKE